MSVLAVALAFTLSIDWSSFTDALTGIVPDAVALAGILVAGVMTIVLVFAGGRAVINWARRSVH
jgi:hypothetical protein